MILPLKFMFLSCTLVTSRSETLMYMSTPHRQVWTVNGSTKKKIWAECKGSSSGWNHASIPVTQVPRGFHLEIRLAAMRGPAGEVAIDDITMGLCGKDMRGFGWGF